MAPAPTDGAQPCLTAPDQNAPSMPAFTPRPRAARPADPPPATLRPMLATGTPAPDFEAPDQNGAAVKLSDLRGRWVVLWWYPKASTPG